VLHTVIYSVMCCMPSNLQIRCCIQYARGSVSSIGYVRLLAHGPAGYENIAKAEECHAMLIFNHVSYVDGIILGAIYLPCGLAKASIADIPFFGKFAKVSAPSIT
jgi:1-acyl-sn-glycerol-3-phosphate acyltransferase